ncbi:hypothetical protein B0H13DRAFT_2353674 [Mycena leptocephala]|nr:hypothetical protein B0H13DRAFT_2353674 [Mycena leptocephala]
MDNDIYFTDHVGNLLQSTWTARDRDLLCSVYAGPEDAPLSILTFRDPAPFLLQPSVPKQLLIELDPTKYAMWYNPHEHWAGWIPRELSKDAMETEEVTDPMGFCFSPGEVETVMEYANVYYSSDEGGISRPTLAGWTLEREWSGYVIQMGRRLHNLCLELASMTEFYTRPGLIRISGEVPNPLDYAKLKRTFFQHSEAQDAATEAKLGTLSLLGFLAWFLSVVEVTATLLSPEEQEFVASLCLKDRSKAGIVYDLMRDHNEVNFAHLLNNKVGFHYVWSDVEWKEARFVRFSPEYYNELCVLRGSENREEVLMEDLPSFNSWRESLLGMDWDCQNLCAGKRGDVVRHFQPQWEYYVVDFHLWGAHPVLHWNAIRAYAEHFKAALGDNHHSTVCTFFRQNPLGVDEPLFLRSEPVHQQELTDFALEAVGESPPEVDIYYESKTIVREQRKIFYAPRLDVPLTRSTAG